MARPTEENTYNPPAPHASYFTPAHANSPGTPFKLDANTPTLFTPLQIREVTLRNRTVVAPMCQYSAPALGPSIGQLTDYHVATLGHYALKGAGLVFIEATGVQPNGRITPNCPGLWDDAQIPGVTRVAEFVKSQGATVGIQLAHAGRKSSTIAPWLSANLKRPSTKAGKSVGGWPEDVVGPTGGESEAWDGKGTDDNGGFYPPRQLTLKEVEEVVHAFADAAKRAVTAGIEVIEVHAAHGYLLHQFLSPITNRRTDRYGGTFANRTRLLIEVVQAVRVVIPPGMPLFVRISTTEWMSDTELGKQRGSWDVEQAIQLAKLLPELGVDLLDCSSGGNHHQQTINMFNSKDYQTKIAGRIRKEMNAAGLKLLIGAVGFITEAEQARDIVEANERKELSDSGREDPDRSDDPEGSLGEEAISARDLTDAKGGKEPTADVILVARQFMREPEWVLRVAWKLGVDIVWPSQFLRVRFPKL